MLAEINTGIFRPGTPLVRSRLGIAFKDGGIGDYICAMSAVRFMARELTHIQGTLLCNNFMHELFRIMLEDFPDWSVGGQEALEELNKNQIPIIALNKMQMPNATGTHLVEIAFQQLLNYDFGSIPPIDTFYPQIKKALNRIKLKKELKIKENYAVITPIATNNLRLMPAEVFNGIVKYLNENNIKPVLLGKSGNKHRKLLYDPNCNFSNSVNLIDKTSLLEAAQIMNKAKMVIGIDNGLLHLAGCTETPIIFGYTIVKPGHREPLRPIGEVINITPDEDELPCSFCHSKMRFIDHQFSECLYDDIKCIKELKLEKWIDGIERILK